MWKDSVRTEKPERKVKKPLPPAIPLTGGSAYSLLIAWQKLGGVVA